MIDLRFNSLGETWINLVHLTAKNGVPMGDEGCELLEVTVTFPAGNGRDAIIERFGDRTMIIEMEKVFFLDGPNSLGHSYAGQMRGPGGRADFEDILSLLRAEPSSKRAVVTFCGLPHGKVPCINVVQFLIRDGMLRTLYYARGQDAYSKFYADGLCIAKMARKVAGGLNLPAGTVTGFLASSHVYRYDLPAIRTMLTHGRSHVRDDGGQGGS